MKHTKIIITTLLLFPAVIFSQEQNDTSFVSLKTGEKIYGEVKFNSPVFGKDYISVNDTTKFYLNEVEYYQTKENYFTVIDGKVARRIQQGKLDTFLAVKHYFYPGTTQSYNTPFGGSFTTYTPGGFVDQSELYFT